MNYEQKYKEALKELREHFLPTTDGTPVSGISRRQIEDIFPELKESEDEKIRKWLIGYFHQYKEDGMEEYANGLKVESIIAWLEKQKDTLKDTLKDIEQKPEWSEKDEEMIEKCLQTINHDRIIHVPKGGDSFHQDEINWLKSLKDRYTWKPSKAQIEAIEDAIEFLGCTEKVREDLKSLHEQLKKHYL